MYVRILLTLLVLLMAIVAVELARPAPLAPLPDPPSPAEAKLDKRIAVFAAENVTLEQAVAMLRHQSGCPIHVDWDSVEIHERGMKDRRVTLRLSDVPVWVALEMIFDPYWAREGLHFNAVGDEVIVSLGGYFTPDKLKLRSYDIRDLLTDEFWGAKTPPGQADAVLADRSSSIANLISTSAGVENYPSFGGSRGDDDYLDGFAWSMVGAGRLFVVETSYGHRRFAIALARLREEAHRPK